MAKTVEETMGELRRDVERWEAEMVVLKEQGQHDLVERLKEWIKESERILARWDKASP